MNMKRETSERHTANRNNSRPLGVSVVICCHNSAQRLAKPLAHLAVQQVPQGIPWEVILIDNASTDGTADFATAHWPATASAPLRVISEPRLGLTHARECGFRE